MSPSPRLRVEATSPPLEDCVIITIKERLGRNPALAGSHLATEVVFR